MQSRLRSAEVTTPVMGCLMGAVLATNGGGKRKSLKLTRKHALCA
jgi:hypothetical protein